MLNWEDSRVATDTVGVYCKCYEACSIKSIDSKPPNPIFEEKGRISFIFFFKDAYERKGIRWTPYKEALQFVNWDF